MLCPEELVALSTAIAVTIAKGKNQQEINMMAAILGHISSSLAVISVQRSVIDACCETQQSSKGKAQTTPTPVPQNFEELL